MTPLDTPGFQCQHHSSQAQITHSRATLNNYRDDTMLMLRAASAFSLCLTLANAAVVSYDFNITWVTANPDGAFERPTIGINGKWPIPQIEADIGDNIVINVQNHLGNQSTSLHFHGLFMNGTTHMDGPSQVSQCAIPPGESFTYNFTVSPWDSIGCIR